MFGEHLHDAMPVRRFDDMRDERLLAERRDVYFAAFRQAVVRPHHQHQRISIKLDRGEFALLGQIRNHADIQLMVQQLARNRAGKNPVYAEVDSRMHVSETVERRQKRVDRAFVHSDGDLPALQAAKFLQSFANFLAHIEHSLGVLEQQHARIGKIFCPGTRNE